MINWENLFFWLNRDRHDFSLNSGERQTGESLARIWRDHILRYQFAADFLKNFFAKETLGVGELLRGADIFCGNGYGSYTIATALPEASILAIDGSREAVKAAKRHYAADNIEFKTKKFPFDLLFNHFDFIVSLESIEHVKCDVRFLKTLAFALKSGGILILSTPNEERLPLENNSIPWHIRHYHKKEFLRLPLAYHLKLLEFHGQDNFILDQDGHIIDFLQEDNLNLQKDYDGQYMIFVFQKK